MRSRLRNKNLVQLSAGNKAVYKNQRNKCVKIRKSFKKIHGQNFRKRN